MLGMRSCFRRIPENLEAVYLVFRMFLVNIALTKKTAAQSQHLRIERQFLIPFNLPSFSGYIVCAEAVLHWGVSDAVEQNTSWLFLRQR